MYYNVMLLSVSDMVHWGFVADNGTMLVLHTHQIIG